MPPWALALPAGSLPWLDEDWTLKNSDSVRNVAWQQGPHFLERFVSCQWNISWDFFSQVDFGLAQHVTLKTFPSTSVAILAPMSATGGDVACSLPVPRLRCFHFGGGLLFQEHSPPSSCFEGGRGAFHGGDCEAVDALYVSTSTAALLCVLHEAQDGVCIATHVGHFDERFRIWQLSDLPPQPPRCQGMSPRGVPPRPPALRLSACPMKFCPPSSFPGRAKALPPARLKPS